MAKLTWNEANTNSLEAKAKALGVSEISQEQVSAIATELSTETGKEVTARSIGSKLRKMGFEVQKASEVAKSGWSEDEANELVQFLNDNAGQHTYTEIAAAVCGGKFSAKQVQGKILSAELTDKVKPTEKAVTPRSYSPEEEAKFVEMVKAGASVEDLAAQFGRNISQIRGKALSLTREGRIDVMPKQTEVAAKERADVLAGLDVANLTVEQIAAQTNTTERGVRSMLTRRGIKAQDYDGAAKQEKIASKKATNA